MIFDGAGRGCQRYFGECVCTGGLCMTSPAGILYTMKKEDKIKVVNAVVAVLDLPERVDRLESVVEANTARLEANTVKLEANTARLKELSDVLTAPPRQGGKIGFASPLVLLEKGVALYQESGAEAYVEKNKEDLLKHFEDITEPYDIQEKAVLLMLQELRTDKDVKNYVFHNAEETIKDVADVAGIALRDIVFEHKGIDIKKHKD